MPERLDYVAEDAGGLEPVSLYPNRNNREKYRENQKNGPEMSTISSPNAASMRAFGGIP
jgi:hypothetical protein